jgi:hypothetical protein
MPWVGFYLWCTTPAGLESAQIGCAVLQNDVVSAPGNVFSSSQMKASFLRFSVSQVFQQRVHEVRGNAITGCSVRQLSLAAFAIRLASQTSRSMQNVATVSRHFMPVDPLERAIHEPENPITFDGPLMRIGSLVPRRIGLGARKRFRGQSRGE